MKRFLLFVSVPVSAVAALALLLASCQSPNLSKQRVAEFQSAAAATGPGPAPGSAAEKEAIARVKDFLSDLSVENVRANTSRVYAKDAYFNDTLKTLRGADEIEAYLLHTAETVEGITVEFDDVARSGSDFYFRWRMDFQAPKLRRGETIRTIGITQVRFDSEGRVVLHQDYWDSMAGLFEHLPVTNQMAGLVRGKL